MMPMGMLPPGFGLPGALTQNPNAMGQQGQGQLGPGGISGMNPMSLQGAGLGQLGGQTFNPAEMMRQQQAMQELMRKSGMFMPGMGGMFMPPKKDDDDKKR